MFRTPEGDAYADLIIDGNRQTWPIRSKQFRFEYIRYLNRKFESLADAGAPLAVTLGPTLKKTAVNAAIDEFEMRAICSRVEREVHVRVASYSGDLYVDLCDPSWHVVRITGGGWTVVQSPPVRFRRTSGMQALPFPEHGTPITALGPFLPNIGEDEFVLVVAFLLMALQPRGPYPIFVAFGEHGVAKTQFIRILRRLIDPNRVESAPLPFSGHDLFIAAHNCHAQAFENVSRLSDQMSDFLCRVSTGAGLRTRSLFTNRDETLFAGARPIMLEGITNFVARGDLLDRAIIFALAPLSNRRPERTLQAEFERQRPGIFGALLDLLATGIRQLPETQLRHPPRMADFATWSVACGLNGFEEAYAANRQVSVEVILEHDLLAQALKELVEQQSSWRGTAQELLNIVGPATKVANPKALSDDLRRLAPMLRCIKIHVAHEPRTADRREITIVRE